MKLFWRFVLLNHVSVECGVVQRAAVSTFYPNIESGYSLLVLAFHLPASTLVMIVAFENQIIVMEEL